MYVYTSIIGILVIKWQIIINAACQRKPMLNLTNILGQPRSSIMLKCQKMKDSYSRSSIRYNSLKFNTQTSHTGLGTFWTKNYKWCWKWKNHFYHMIFIVSYPFCVSKYVWSSTWSSNQKRVRSCLNKQLK